MRTDLSPAAKRALARQCGVTTIEQLVTFGMSENAVRAQVSAQRWQRFGSHSVLTHNHEPTRPQLMWLAVLDPTCPVALAGLSALEVLGFKYFGEEASLVHIIVPRGAKSHPLPGVRVHESRRFRDHDVDVLSPIPRTQTARSALDAGAWQPSPRYACGILAAVVQQRLCAALDLESELRFVGRVRHKASMRLAVLDIAGGAEALSEIDVAAMCRAYGLRAPDRQRVRKDRAGRRRYLDCEWVLPDGSIVVLEVDGSHHFQVEHWGEDIKRERGVVISGRKVLRATSYEVRHEQRELAADLIAIGVPPL